MKLAIKMRYTAIFFFLFYTIIVPSLGAVLELEQLPQNDIKRVEKLISKLAPVIEDRQRHETLTTLTFKELYAPLTKDEKKFLWSFQNLNAKKLGVKIPFRGIATGKEVLVPIKGQTIKIKGETKGLSTQFLPKEVFDKYTAMMSAMDHDIGKRLYLESGYRSSAYQLYLFVYYLKNHHYSIQETVRFNALVGYSEHGSPEHQALDFINEDGINGEDNPTDFDVLPEYKWLLTHAKDFGFIQSYPQNAQKGITYEPWHWRYEKDEHLS